MVYGHYKYCNSFSAGTVFLRQNLMYKDGPRVERVKSVYMKMYWAFIRGSINVSVPAVTYEYSKTTGKRLGLSRSLYHKVIGNIYIEKTHNTQCELIYAYKLKNVDFNLNDSFTSTTDFHGKNEALY